MAALCICLASCGGGAQHPSSHFERLGRPRAGEWRRIFPEPEQSFEQYKIDMGRALAFEKRSIRLLPLGELQEGDDALFVNIRAVLSAYFMTKVAIEPRRDMFEDITKRTSRGYGLQHRAGDILSEAARDLPGGTVARLCITQEDMYDEYSPGVPVRYVFGMGSANERTAVISFARFRMRYPSQRPIANFLRRAIKVAAHEVGHCFGLMNCSTYACGMNGSIRVAESDSRPIHLCPDCARKLEWHLGFDPRVRYAALAKAYADLGWLEESAFVARLAESVESRGVPRPSAAGGPR
jgi:archaemetzincin